MAKHDGWTIKSYFGRNPWLLTSYYHSTRKEVIKDFEETTGESWRKFRRKGHLGIIKVKLIEVEEG